MQYEEENRKRKESYRLYFQPNLNSPNSFKFLNRRYYRKHNGIAQFYYEHVSQRCVEAKSTEI